MNSGANDTFIQNRSAANGPLSEIAENYDSLVNSVDRSQSHSHITPVGDLQEVTDVLCSHNLMTRTDGRHYATFQSMPMSLWNKIDDRKMKIWLLDKIEEYAFELGN